jgi:hypothetical protein
LSASAGTPKIAAASSTAVPEPAAPLRRAAAVDRNRELIDRRDQRSVAHLEPRGPRSAGAPEPQHAVRRSEMIELVVGPAREHDALLGIAHHNSLGAELDQHGMPHAGDAVEEDAFSSHTKFHRR